MSTLSAEQTLSTPQLSGLVSSATYGWSSAFIDSSAYDDIEFQVSIDPANTAPANSKGFYIFAWGASNSGAMPTTGAYNSGTVGTQGYIAFPDITTLPNNLIVAQFITYQNANVLQVGSPFSINQALQVSKVPPFCGLAVLNHSGAKIEETALTTIKWRGVNY